MIIVASTVPPKPHGSRITAWSLKYDYSLITVFYRSNLGFIVNSNGKIRRIGLAELEKHKFTSGIEIEIVEIHFSNIREAPAFGIVAFK